jgi:Domain of unknown function (DUF4276)
VVTEIRIYCEGGGDGPGTKDPFKEGMSKFLKPLIDLLRSKRIRFYLIPCGGGSEAYKDFKIAISIHRDAFNVLLVDSEGPVAKNPWKHLRDRDNWDAPGCDEDQCYLMVQTMEAWLIADLDALKKFYGQGFNARAIPKNPDVEKIPKDQLEPALKQASRNTQPGEYQKIRHGAKLLAMLDSAKVRKASPHCDRLFSELKVKIES